MTSLAQKAQAIFDSISQVVIGKPEAVKLTLTAFLAGGHVLLEDMPGVGKTLLAKALARSFEGSFKRIQFTSDIMPTDITGSSIYNLKTSEFEFVPGPVFSHIVLADEINRATPRSQSSLLEVMEEQQVTIDGKTYSLEKPFFVIATQNPVDSYGTFPLPESQLDRFMLSLSIGYPNFEQELEILKLHKINSQTYHSTSLHERINSIINAEETRSLQTLVTQIEVCHEIQKLIVQIIQKTRSDQSIAVGASTRAAVAFLRASQALAFLEKRKFVIPDDIKFLAPYILSHRIVIRQINHRQEKEAFIQSLLSDIFFELRI